MSEQGYSGRSALTDLIVAADWSTVETKRWMVRGERVGDGYVVSPPEPVGDHKSLMARLRRTLPDDHGLLIGFDFPIGLPVEYAQKASVDSFRTFLLEMAGRGEWERFYQISDLPSLREPAPPPIDGIALAEAVNLLRTRVVRGPREPGIVSAPPRRRSGRSNAIGRRAEELVYQRLTRAPGLANVRWVSQMGQLDGFDLDYEAEGVQHVVEVKGTSGTFFPCVELTINEWKAAERYRDRFHLYLVTRCESPAPCVQVVHDPFGLFEAQQAAVSPLMVRFELIAAAAHA